MKSNSERRREYYRERFKHESGGKRERKQGLEICGKKRFGVRTEERDTWKWRRGKCVRLQISADFSRTVDVTEQNTSIPGRGNHLSTVFPPHKGEHLSPLYLSSLLPEQYVAGRERWQGDREGKTYSANSIYSHSSSVTGFSSSYLSIRLTPYLSGEAKWRRLIWARSISCCSYDAGSFQSDKQAAFDLRCQNVSQFWGRRILC